MIAELGANGGMTMAASIALLVNAIAILVERQDLDVASAMDSPRFQHLCRLVGRPSPGRCWQDLALRVVDPRHEGERERGNGEGWRYEGGLERWMRRDVSWIAG